MFEDYNREPHMWGVHSVLERFLSIRWIHRVYYELHVVFTWEYHIHMNHFWSYSQFWKCQYPQHGDTISTSWSNIWMQFRKHQFSSPRCGVTFATSWCHFLSRLRFSQTRRHDMVDTYPHRDYFSLQILLYLAPPVRSLLSWFIFLAIFKSSKSLVSSNYTTYRDVNL